MQSIIIMPGVLNSLVFSAIGIIVLVLAFAVVDMLTAKYHLWTEIVQKQNIALAILLGSYLLGVAMIIAAAVHG